MSTTIGILIFDGAAELNFLGHWEVFTMAAALRERGDATVLEGPRHVRDGGW
jgi:hypothetical protein